jgi:hypothetical protein
MLKQLILVLSLVQLMQCLSVRSDIWWSRRDDNLQEECYIDYENKNPSLEAKICGYCFIKCQQQLAACLQVRLDHVTDDSINYCQNMLNECQPRCWNDKRTRRIAEANWPMVAKSLPYFDPSRETMNEKINNKQNLASSR